LIEMTIVCRSPTIMPTHSRRVGEIFNRVVNERGIRLICNQEATATEGALICGDGTQVAFDECIWCTQGAAQSWIKKSGFDVDEHGFLCVNTHLESTNTPDVFGGGDIISIRGHPRPKAGVFAVMAGMPLAINLKKRLEGQPLTEEDKYIPQSAFLGLIGLGDGNCVASKGNMAVEGRYLWALKDWIDRKWMYVYKEGLPDMEDMMPPPDPPSLAAVAAGAEALAMLHDAPMRCGGCGAKVGATALSAAMKVIEPRVVRRPEVIMGVDSPDDCAVVAVGEDNKMLNIHSVDFFRSFYEDPYVFGQIAANHALSDCHAMCAPSVSALAIVVVPFGLEDKVTATIIQMMAGACEALKESNCALVGGHTCEGKEMALGFVINGVVSTSWNSKLPTGCLAKSGMKPGDVLVLTKAIGTGVLFAARMRNKSKGRWIQEALSSMICSSRKAADLALEHGATACTDVTGFGLLGHLVEMCQASGCSSNLDLSKVPVLSGAVECTKSGIFSSLQPQNLRLRRAVRGDDTHDTFPIIFDPQTSGGLLVSLPASEAPEYITALRRSGYLSASIIGDVADSLEAPLCVSLIS
jgi:selenide,water dikinase